mgnify:CR=1 FL=1
MDRKEFRDYNGRLLAYAMDEPNGCVVLYDFFGRILGRYDSGLDVTMDFYGRIVGRGNMLSSLIPSWEELNRR